MSSLRSKFSFSSRSASRKRSKSDLLSAKADELLDAEHGGRRVLHVDSLEVSVTLPSLRSKDGANPLASSYLSLKLVGSNGQDVGQEKVRGEKAGLRNNPEVGE